MHRGLSGPCWACTLHSAESVPFAGRFAVRDLVDGLSLRRGSREGKHGKVAQHTSAVVAAFGSSLPTVGNKIPPARVIFQRKFGSSLCIITSTIDLTVTKRQSSLLNSN